MASTPPFGLILPSRPVLVNATVISVTQCAFIFPSTPTFTHIVVFLLPGTVLPDDTLAGVYLQSPGSTSGFRLLGAIGSEKQSAIFKVTDGSGKPAENAVNGSGIWNGVEDEMFDVDGTTAVDTVTVGISVEPAATIAAQLESLKSANPSPPFTAVVMRSGQQARPASLSTKVLAQRIIENAFNFLASFAGTTGVGGQEVVPLKSFQEWWSKFERRVENDPGFLERETDN